MADEPRRLTLRWKEDMSFGPYWEVEGSNDDLPDVVEVLVLPVAVTDEMVDRAATAWKCSLELWPDCLRVALEAALNSRTR